MKKWQRSSFGVSGLILILAALSPLALAQTRAQQLQLASLHPQLAWQQTSPTPANPSGPVLYQIIFRSSATPGNVPVISPQFTLMNSHIFDSGSALSFTEPVTFASGQTFPGAGTITGIATINGLTGGGNTGSITLGIANGGVGTSQIANNAVTPAQIGSGAAANGAVLAADGSGGVAFVALPVEQPEWLLGGNIGTGCSTSPCAVFLGTTDNDPFEIRVNNTRAVRIEPPFASVFAPNIIGGFSGNFVNNGAAGATIAGGGTSISNFVNSVTSNFGTVSGGYANIASGAAVVAGGSNNSASGGSSGVSSGQHNTASGNESVVGGGDHNQASNANSVVAGGQNNIAGGSHSAVGGGSANEALGLYSTIAGGNFNGLSGVGSFAVGQNTADNTHNGDFLWGDNNTNGLLIASADNQFLARATGGFQFITNVDGNGNPLAANTVSIAPTTGLMTFANNQTFPGVLPLSGGTMTGNITFAGTQTFPGSVNTVTAADSTITVAGTPSAPTLAVGSINSGNIATGQVVKSLNGLFDGVTLAAGTNISLLISGQTVTISNLTPAAWNLAGNAGTGCSTSPCADFMGSTDNDPIEFRVDNQRAFRIEPANETQFGLGFAPNVVAGFSGNSVSGTGTGGATIAGGGAASAVNSVSASFGTIAGGQHNTASSVNSTVSGGSTNTASGINSAVAGGANNTASGQGSFAAGQFTSDNNGAPHNGVFLWGDDSTFTQGSNAQLIASADNQFLARATGGFQFITGITGTGAPDATKTVTIAPNSGIISFVSGQTFPGTGSVTSVTAADSTITVGGTPSAPTVAVGSINAGNINTGQVVKNLNGQTDAVIIAGSNGLSASAASGTVTITSNATPNNSPDAIVARDAAGNFAAGTLALAGNLALPSTASGGAAGVITLGGSPVLDAFGPNNTFVGLSAGSTTLSGQGNTGMGSSALLSLTTGSQNSAFGFNALSNTSTGISNSAFGSNALVNNSGSFNDAFGNGALTNNTGSQNDAFGYQALLADTSGSTNDAFGYQALTANTTGANNAAFGDGALAKNTNGGSDSAFGYHALNANSGGASNAAFGFEALSNSTNGGNSAFGANALQLVTTGGINSAFGAQALQQLASGSFNIAIGDSAGFAFTGAESNNIDIGSNGVGTAGDMGIIRIGTSGTQNAAFIAGISGVTIASGSSVLVSSSGQLGTVLSSRRYKHEITSMGDSSDVLMKLRPVTFFYKPNLDPTQTRQYGLVAEEVAKVAPQLVLFGNDGLPQTVRYRFVNAMLLNEFQKQQRQLDAQQQQNKLQAATIAQQQGQLAAQAAQIKSMQIDMNSARSREAALQQQMQAVMLRLASLERSQRENYAQRAAR